MCVCVCVFYFDLQAFVCILLMYLCFTFLGIDLISCIIQDLTFDLAASSGHKNTIFKMGSVNIATSAVVF